MTTEARPLYAAILGFGTVGQGIYNIIQAKQSRIAEQLGGRPLVIVKVLVRDAKRAHRTLPPGFPASALLTDRIDDVFAAVPAGERLDVLFEATVGEEPAYTYLTRALSEEGCRAVVTANKVMFAGRGASLRALASSKTAEQMATTRTPGATAQVGGWGTPHCFVGFEACVAGGVPVIKTLQNMSRVQSITEVEGILNGTSNYMLTKMRVERVSYAEALREAQEKGYAEADPTNDVSGMDAFYKLMIASELAFGRQPDWESVPVVGIDSLTEADLAVAESAGQRYRHVCRVTARVLPNGSQQLEAAVRPQEVGVTHPLYHVDGVLNAVVVHTDYLGAVTLMGPGAGMFPTASVMVEDYLTSVGQHAL